MRDAVKNGGRATFFFFTNQTEGLAIDTRLAPAGIERKVQEFRCKCIDHANLKFVVGAESHGNTQEWVVKLLQKKWRDIGAKFIEKV